MGSNLLLPDEPLNRKSNDCGKYFLFFTFRKAIDDGLLNKFKCGFFSKEVNDDARNKAGLIVTNLFSSFSSFVFD